MSVRHGRVRIRISVICIINIKLGFSVGAIISALNYFAISMLHQRLVGFGSEVHHKLLDDIGGFLHIAVAVITCGIAACVSVALAIDTAVVRGSGIDTVVSVAVIFLIFLQK